jgi:heme a synthase
MEASARKSFARFVWATFAVNLLVVLWGGYVRASGSGAGCGSHWPTCSGEVVPTAPSIKTLVELSHRVTSGIALLLVVACTVLAFLRFEKGSAVRFFAVTTLLLMLSEALVGAGLVLFELVAHNASMKRALSMALHMSNTFLLLASMGLTAVSASVKLPRLRDALRDPWNAATLVLVFITGLTGAIAALGDTLFPVKTLLEGLAQDLNPASHLLLRLRSAHPFLAVTTATIVLLFAARSRNGGVWSKACYALVAAQTGVGILNLLLLAPIPFQLAHLVMADTLFVVTVLCAVVSHGERAPTAPAMLEA